MSASRELDAVLAHLDGCKPIGDGESSYSACCPAHDDGQQSFAIAVGKSRPLVMVCYAGCKFADIKTALVAKGVDPKIFSGEPKGITVEELAFAKRLPVEFLRECGVCMHESGRKVGIPYYAADPKPDGSLKVFRWKIRYGETGHDEYWHKGKGSCAYGLWKLKGWRDSGIRDLIIVEGESDCWTLWYHGFAAIGIPGSQSAGVINSEIIEGFERLVVWRETDDGGSNFAAKVAKKLESIEAHHRGFLIDGNAAKVKDPNNLYKRDPEKFKQLFEELALSASHLPPYRELFTKKKNLVPKSIQEAQEVIVKRPIPEPGYYSMTDMGNSERLIHRYRGDVRFCNHWKDWLIWDGTRFLRDENLEIWQRTDETVGSIQSEADRTSPTAEGKILKELLTQHRKSSESKRARDDMIKGACHIEGVPISPLDMDADPMLLNVQNGTIDLRTGECRPHNRADMMTKLAPVTYDPVAECPTFMKFINRIMGNDSELVNYLQVAMGYSLTGVIKDNAVFFCYGGGNNGKSTFLELMSDILGMGQYAAKTSAETILELGNARNSSAPTPEISALVGVRFLAAAEIPEGKKLNEARIKEFTGKDTISARGLQEKQFNFRPQFKLWMHGNHKPVIKGVDEGIWRRIHLIPFRVTIPKHEVDFKLGEKMLAEASGILNWIIKGCLQWQRTAIVPPAAVREATKEYRADMDLMGEFIDECCETGDGLEATASELYIAYENWCKWEQHQQMSKRAFGLKLKDRAFVQDRDEGSRRWKGIRVVPGNLKSKGGASDSGRGFSIDSIDDI